MRRTLFVVSIVALGCCLVPGWASSHREAPLISGDPQVDGTDVYAFVSPDDPSTVTFIANFIPFQAPAGGPNFFSFDPNARYEILIDNDGDAVEDIVFRWKFSSHYRRGDTFLYNTGPVTGANNADLNFSQTYDFTVLREGRVVLKEETIPVPPVNVGASTPDYGRNFSDGHPLPFPEGMGQVAAGQFDDPFFLDLRVFDLLYGGDLSETGNDSLAGFNVHAIAVQVPKQLVTRDAVIGVWAVARRPAMTVRTPHGASDSGEFVQVSRLGMPLVNEVVIPVSRKDVWNGSHPSGDGQFLRYVQDPEVPRLLEALYAIPAPATPRADLVSVFLTGVPGLNQPPTVTPSEQLRLNTGIAPSASPHRLGVFGGDTAGFPNGRRLIDDVLDVTLQAAAGALVGAAVDQLGDGVNANDVAFRSEFPYLGVAHSGGKPTSLKR